MKVIKKQSYPIVLAFDLGAFWGNFSFLSNLNSNYK